MAVNTVEDKLQLRAKTDHQLVEMVRDLTIDLYLIAQEQSRRMASQDQAAQDSEVNEGGRSNSQFPAQPK